MRAPWGYIKIAYDPDTGRAIGLILPNRKIVMKQEPLDNFVEPIAAIEDATGLDFFHVMSIRAQNVLETDRKPLWGVDPGCTRATA